MADNRKLAAGLRNLPASAQEDLYGYSDGFNKSQIANALRNAGEQGIGIAKSVARGVPQMATGFIDLAAMPFEAAGIVKPGQSVGSTKWLEEKGYLPPPQEGFVNQTAEMVASGLDPSTWASHALPLVAGIGKTVWHGSPHTFEKFDLSKIGTGEGAQSYGHGLYLAEAKPTAQKYAQDLSSETFRVGNEVFDPSTLQHLNVRSQARTGNVDEAINKALQLSQSDSPVANLARQDLEVLQNIKAQGGMVPNEGQLYKVDLPDEQIAKMLDWDKPLSEQPQNVQEALARFDPDMYHVEGGDYDPTELGQMVYSRMSQNPAEASQRMYEAGIPGIQYLDQASRGAGDGTRNYVVFSDEIPQILERNNQVIK